MKVREVSSKRGFFNLDFKEIWSYRDLLFLFIRRDFVSVYKQTILGPIWFFIQPIFTTLIFSVIFGRLAQISTDGLPAFLFYLTGISCWNYFADCLLKTSNTFVLNSGLFGKVYFPRLITPLSIVMSNLLKLGVKNIEIVKKDTYTSSNNFFSARRSLKNKLNDYGRNISVIMIK